MAGLKVPAKASVIPVPLQVPPVVAADKLNEASSIHTGPTGAMVGSGAGST